MFRPNWTIMKEFRVVEEEVCKELAVRIPLKRISSLYDRISKDAETCKAIRRILTLCAVKATACRVCIKTRNCRLRSVEALLGRFHPFYRPRRPLGRVTLVLDLGTRRGWGVSVTPRPLSTPKDRGPILQAAGWAPGPVWTGAENLARTGIRSPDCPARNQSLYRLIYRAHRSFSSFRFNFRAPLLWSYMNCYVCVGCVLIGFDGTGLWHFWCMVTHEHIHTYTHTYIHTYIHTYRVIEKDGRDLNPL
jgi:hypothetical protein